VVLRMGTVWLEDRWQALPNLSIQGRVAYSRGRPGAAEHLSTGSATSYKRREFGFDAVDVALEGQLTLADIHTLTVGSDFTLDHEMLMRVYSVDAMTDEEVLEAGPEGSRDFHNTGAYAQYRIDPLEGIHANVAGRYDHHNIYGDVFTYRVGWVHSIVPAFTYKLLYGTSYRAPTAVQLFGQSLYAVTQAATRTSCPSAARTAELGLEWRVLDELALLATGCWIEVEDKVEVVERGILARPQNLAKQRSLCAEGELKWIHKWSTLLGTFSYAHGRTTGLATALSSIEDERDTDLYPQMDGEPALERRLRALRHGRPSRCASWASARRRPRTRRPTSGTIRTRPVRHGRLDLWHLARRTSRRARCAQLARSALRRTRLRRCGRPGEGTGDHARLSLPIRVAAAGKWGRHETTSRMGAGRAARAGRLRRRRAVTAALTRTRSSWGCSRRSPASWPSGAGRWSARRCLPSTSSTAPAASTGASSSSSSRTRRRTPTRP
jgi:hypothetical protein